MKDVDLALSQISSIRAQLAASTRFLGIAPGLNMLTAAFVFMVAVIQSLRPDRLFHNDRHFIAVWASVIIVVCCVSVVEATSRAHRLHGPMAYAMLSAALQKALPFYAAGAVITWVICAFSPESIRLLPGLWQLLIALLGFSAIANLPREIIWAAVWYFLCGALVLGVAGSNGMLSPWMMGIPFTIGHLLVAVILKRANNESHRCE